MEDAGDQLGRRGRVYILTCWDVSFRTIYK